MRSLALLAAAAAAGLAAAQESTRLRVEYLENPIGLDEPTPRFSWAPVHPTRGATMASYSISVKTAGGTPVWSSGTVASNVSTNVAYGGPALTSDTDYVWTVGWTDNAGVQAAAASGTFSTGLFAPGDWQAAAYVGGTDTNYMLRAEFNLPTGSTRARLYISGLGYYKSWINGVMTDDHELGQFTTFERRVLYDAWDVSDLVHEGCNGIGVLLGDGWYSQSSVHVGPRSLLVLLSITGADGSTYLYASTNASSSDAVLALAPVEATATLRAALVSPLPFTSAASPVTSDDVYNGENYDFRLEQPGFSSCSFSPLTPWAPSVLQPDPRKTAALSWHPVQINVDRDYSVVAITQPPAASGDWVLDFGQNMAGIFTLNLICPQGSQWVYLHFGESLHQDGTVLNQYGNIMNSNVTCAGTGDVETYRTLFSYYGYRFVQIKNFPGVPDETTMMAHFIHSDVESVGGFSTDNTLLNSVQHCTRFASLSNLMDVPTDCPQRERRGWLGDAQLSAEVTIHNFDMAAFYTKWLRDIRDSQLFYNASSNGQLPDCIPFYNHGGLPADPAWSVAYPLITNWVSSYYADDRIVAEHYQGVRDYVESELRQVENGLLTFARYGDWCSVADGAGTSCVFTRGDISTWTLIHSLDILADFATRLGNNGDATRYSGLAATTRQAYTAAYYHDQGVNSYVSDGYPISQILALEVGGVVPESDNGAVFNTLVNEIVNGSRSGYPMNPTVGIIGTKHLWPVLTAGGRTDLAIALHLARGMPSWSYWIDGAEPGVSTPATTLWENWQSTSFDPYGSYNHIMYGGFGSWFYSTLGGLGRAPGSVGWTNLLINPPAGVSPNLTSASASVDTPVGLAAVDWTTSVPNTGSCGLVPENAVLNLTCVAKGGAPGNFTEVLFASFGTPTGSCPSFAASPSCNAPASVAVVTQACIGKASCSIEATNTAFGGDPCVNTVKALAVSLAGNCEEIIYQLTATVPTSSVATVVVSTGGQNPSSVTIFEGTSTRTPVWNNGSYVPGVQGVTGAQVLDSGHVAVTTGGGTYTFAIAK